MLFSETPDRALYDHSRIKSRLFDTNKSLLVLNS